MVKSSKGEMKIEKINSLVTTYNSGIDHVKKYLLPQLKNCNVLVSHQIIDKKIKPEKKFLGKNVKYFPLFNKGLSKNRNNILKRVNGGISIITDDDEDFISGFEEVVRKAYSKLDKADVITFSVLDENGKNLFNLKNKVFKHSVFSAMKVYSQGITFRTNSVKSKGIIFDENFGIGAKFGAGEEQIFLKDCLDKKLKVYHWPTPIVGHPRESTGRKWNENLIKTKSAVAIRMFGKFFSIPLLIGLFLVRYHKAEGFSKKEIINNLIKGYKEYLNLKKENKN